MNDEAAKTYVEDVEKPGLREPTSGEADELRADAEDAEDVENAENVENAEYSKSSEDIANRESDEFAEADERADYAETDEPVDYAETKEPVDYAVTDEFEDAEEADEPSGFAETEEPSDIVAVEEPDYPDYPVTAPSTTPSTTPADASEPLLAPSVTEDFRDRWSEVQIGFVEDPQKSVAEADALLAELARAYQQAVEERRSRIAAVRADGSADTEDLRSALLGYREILTTILPAA